MRADVAQTGDLDHIETAAQPFVESVQRQLLEPAVLDGVQRPDHRRHELGAIELGERVQGDDDGDTQLEDRPLLQVLADRRPGQTQRLDGTSELYQQASQIAPAHLGDGDLQFYGASPQPDERCGA